MKKKLFLASILMSLLIEGTSFLTASCSSDYMSIVIGAGEVIVMDVFLAMS